MPCTTGSDAIQLLKLVLEGSTQSVRTVSASTPPTCLNDYPELLSSTLGTYPNFSHTIALRENAQPSAQRVRMLPIAQRETVKTEIDRMVQQGIWEPCDRSDWVHGLVPVWKQDGSVRITTDLTQLNIHVIPARHPQPNIRDIHRVSLTGAKFFSRLDLTKAYYHIQLSAASRPLTATITPWGLYQYCRLPMGLKDSAAIFQRCVEQALSGIVRCVTYIDDILVFGESREEHDSTLSDVLARLHQHNFRLNLSKCEFNRQCISFLGNMFSYGYMQVDPQRLQGVCDMANPTNTKQLQSFLGAVNYYCRA